MTLWETASGKVRASLRGHRGFVLSVVFVPGNLLTSAGEDGVVRLWELGSGKQWAALKGHDRFIHQLAATRKMLASAGDDGTVRLWDTVTGKQLLVLKLAAAASSVRFTSDGKLLAAGDAGGTIRLWSVVKLLGQKGKR